MKDIKKYMWSELKKKYDREGTTVIYVDLDGVLADFEFHIVDYFNDLLSNPSDFFVTCYQKAMICGDEYLKYRDLIARIKEDLGSKKYITYEDLRPKYKGTKGKPYTEEWYEHENYFSFATYRLVFNNIDFWSGIPQTTYFRQIYYSLEAMKEQYDFELHILTTPMLKMGEGHGCYIGKHQWVGENIKTPIEVIFEKDKEKYASSNALLVDDSSSNCEKFKEAGGYVFKVDPSPGKFNYEDFKKTIKSFLVAQQSKKQKIPAYVTDIVIDNKTQFPKY